MTLFAELNGVRVVEAVATLPLVGAWHVDVKLDVAPSDLATGPKASVLTLGGLTLVGTLVRAPSPWFGAMAVRLVGGAAGWRRTVPEKSYQSDAGVKLGIVVGDAAREVGESVKVTDDRIIGDAYVRERAVATRVLQHLCPGGWFIDVDGTTVIGDRDASAIGSPFDVLEHDGAINRFEVATEAPADWAPGRRFVTAQSGSRVLSLVIHKLTASALRTEVLCDG